ncbi:MAG: twin-arginine translocase subunit TatC [Desulfoarculaceae bacterium]|nr:twin-arginine translocase subunit TatC [Desulfoarculaceae bacterium]
MMITRSLELFAPHHQELRKRLIKVFLTVIACTAVAYGLSEHIARIFLAPLFHASPLIDKLVYTNLPEAFISYIKLSLLVGIVASFPIILYQVWMFIAPGLKSSEKKFTIMVVFWATLLFASGAAFALLAVLPKMLHYFMSYASPSLEPLPKFGAYLTFVARTMLAFGLSFEIPFLMVMSGKAGFVQPGYFRKKRLSFYAAIVVLAFLLTAGDFMATAMLAIPLFGLYEAGIFLTALLGTKKK